jgi:hypothetical protein
MLLFSHWLQSERNRMLGRTLCPTAEINKNVATRWACGWPSLDEKPGMNNVVVQSLDTVGKRNGTNLFSTVLILPACLCFVRRFESCP